MALNARAATVTVTSTGTATVVDGAVTLPEAIISIEIGSNMDSDVSAVGAYGTNDTIHFAIPGGGVHTISLPGGLAITKAVTIDGYSQPGSSANTLAVGDNAILTIELSGGGFSINGDGTVIRGLVINNFQYDGILVLSSGNTIAGNFIGTNTAGSAPLPSVISSAIGIELYALSGNTVSNNTIGGTAPADRNVISGLGASQVEIHSDGSGIADSNAIEGNYIGASADGLTAIGSYSTHGVRVFDADHTLIGGTTGTTPGGGCTGACNVIWGLFNAVTIGDQFVDPTVVNTVGTKVQGNFIGPNAAGDANLNPDGGTLHIRFITGGVTVGGTTPAARNVISGGGAGIFIAGDQGPVLPIVIQGNYLGLNSAGTATLPGSPNLPGYYGVYVSGSNVVIGGTAPGAGNVFGYTGIQNTTQIDLDGADNASIQGNLIGTLADGVTAAGMHGAGVRPFSTTNVTIGATTAGGAGGNVIAGNEFGGVLIPAAGHCRILGNSMFGNGDIPIDLDAFGVTPNDDCDGDSGPNDLQNFPVITSAVSNGTSITINGTLNSTAGSTFALDFFSDTAASGQARTPLGAGSVNTGAGCNGTFSATLPFTYLPSMVVRATATNGTGNTSEFSATVPVVLSGPAVAKSFGPNVIGAGSSSVMTITLTNTTSVPVNGLSMTDSYPVNLVNAPVPAASTTCGGSLSATAGGGAVMLSGGDIPASGSCTITVTLTSQVPNLYTNMMGAGTVTSSNTLPNAVGSTAVLTVAVPLIVTKAFSPTAVLPNDSSELTIRLSNPNPFPVTGAAFTDNYPSGLLNASPASAATTCGGSVTISSSSITLSGGTVPANSSCVVTVAVVSPTEKQYSNVLPVGSVTALNAPPSGVAASALLIVSTNIPTFSSAGLLLLAAALAVMSCIALNRS